MGGKYIIRLNIRESNPKAFQFSVEFELSCDINSLTILQIPFPAAPSISASEINRRTYVFDEETLLNRASATRSFAGELPSDLDVH